MTDRVFIGHRRNGRHLGDHAVARNLALRWIVDVGRVVIECRQRANGAHHDGHGMGVTPVAGEKPRHLLMHHRVVCDGAAEIDELLVVRQLSMQKQIANGEERGVFGQLIDGVAAIQQLALVAVDESNLAGAIGGRGEARIVGEAAGLFVEMGNVHDVGANRARADRHIDGFAVERKFGRYRHISLTWLLILYVHALAPGTRPFRAVAARLRWFLGNMAH